MIVVGFSPVLLKCNMMVANVIYQGCNAIRFGRKVSAESIDMFRVLQSKSWHGVSLGDYAVNIVI